jgi:hypothetical protein
MRDDLDGFTQIDQRRGGALPLDLLGKRYELARELHELYNISSETDGDQSFHIVERIEWGEQKRRKGLAMHQAEDDFPMSCSQGRAHI